MTLWFEIKTHDSKEFFEAKNIQTLELIFDSFETPPIFCLHAIGDPIVF